jgi:squalene synthase HpnC
VAPNLLRKTCPEPTKIALVDPLAAEKQWLTSRIATLTQRRARQENFPVASRVLRTTTRQDLLDIYILARLIDDIGDEAPGDRLGLLDVVDTDLLRLTSGDRPELEPVAALTTAVRERGLPVDPFRDLVEANRMDQTVTRYADLEALRGYCRLSANPVGRLVLAVWHLDDADRCALSDEVCTGLQIAEHLQDVAEDLRAGRIYLPQDAMARHGVTDTELGAPTETLSAQQAAAVAALLGELAGVARGMLAHTRPLAATLPGVFRIAVAGFGAGGEAALDAVVAAGPAAVHTTPRPVRRRLLGHTTRTLAGAGRDRLGRTRA